MWTRFFPAAKEWKRLIVSGEIGSVRSVHVTFGFKADDQEFGRLIDPVLGGGALLDIGVYVVHLAIYAFGKTPKTVNASARMHNGVDIQNSFILGFDDGQAVLTCGFGSDFYANTAEIVCTKGSILIRKPFWTPTELVIKTATGENTLSFPLPPNTHTWNFTNSVGLHYEALAVQEDILNGKTENSIMPLSDSLAVMEVMDQIRAQIGLIYPQEQ